METEEIEQIRSFDVWRRNGQNGLTRYRCFEDCSSHRFCVQSADFYKEPISAERIAQLEKQYIELLLQDSPFNRSGAFPTIEEAIADHDASFE
jgi:hypothetical protein